MVFMKKWLIVSVLVFAICLPLTAGAQDFKGQPYGVTTNGVYFLDAKVWNKAEGDAPKVMYGPAWNPKPMKLVGGYYIYESGLRKRLGVKTDYCFDIGGDRFIPHALVEDPIIKDGDFVDNGRGGYNFRTAPIE
jgi:hypothetical protein